MNWEAKPIKHRGESRIAIYFDRDIVANNRIRKLTGVRWSATLKVWHLPDEPHYRTQFKLQPAQEAGPPLNEFNKGEVKRLWGNFN
jgi:integrase/recombinase XerD